MTLETTRAPKGFNTKPKNGGTYHKGKDGKWYSYQDLSVANRRYLQAKFELDKVQEMNLQAKKDRANSNKKKRKSTTGSTAPSTPPASSRRSSRLQMVSPENPKGLNDEELAELKEEAKLSAKRYKPSKHRSVVKAVELSEEDREKLKDLPDWMDKFHEYLLTVDNISDANCRNVMKQTEKMATGVGITYHHWKEGTWFYRGTKIDLSFDFDKLHDEAVEMENKHGRDKGNGWLMRHAITKLQKFQQYVKEEE